MYISTKIHEREKWVKLSITLNITLKATKMIKAVIRLRKVESGRAWDKRTYTELDYQVS